MAKTEELFELIQSMSKGEKRYFKVYTSKLKKKDITYIKIFDLIVTQPSYDKESFIKKIKNPKILKQLHVINNYLYHKILDSLEAYHQDRFVHLAIIKMLNQSFVLIKRGLYHQAATFLSRAKKQIIATEKYELIPELLRQERTINTRKILPQKPEEILTPLREDAKTILQKLDDFNTFADLNLLFFIALSNLLAKKSGAEADLKKLMDHPFLDKKKPPKDLRSLIAHLSIHASFCEVNLSFEDALKYRSETLELMEGNPYLIQEYPENYLTILNNLMTINQHLEMLDMYQNSLSKVANFEPPEYSKDIQVMHFRIYERHQLVYRLLKGEFKACLNIIDEIKNRLNKWDNQIDEKLKYRFRYYFSYIYFANEQYDQALDLLEELSSNFPKRFLYFAKEAQLMQLLIYHDQGLMLLLDSRLRSIKRKWKKYSFIEDRDQCILNWLSKDSSLLKPSDWQCFFNKLTHLKKIKFPIYSTPIHNMLEVWILSKIKRCSYKKAYIILMDKKVD